MIAGAVSWVFHWLWVLTMCGWQWFVWRRAAEARARMEEALRRCNSRPPDECCTSQLGVSVNVLSDSLDKYLGHDFRDRWLESGRELAYKLRQLAGNRHGRAVIALCAATHGLFAGLLVRLLVNL